MMEKKAEERDRAKEKDQAIVTVEMQNKISKVQNRLEMMKTIVKAKANRAHLGQNQIHILVEREDFLEMLRK